MPNPQQKLREKPKNVSLEEICNRQPSVYIADNILNHKQANLDKGIYFKGDHSLFCNGHEEDEKLVRFEIYAKSVKDNFMKMNSEYDTYCSAPTDSGSDGEENSTMEPLKITIQQAPHGIVINSNVYLTYHQWNTIIFIDEKTVRCCVCDLIMKEELCTTHIAMEKHSKILDLHKPIERYDLSITRKVRHNYHCGVCNDIFPSTEEYDHYSGKIHEGNLLFSINKVSDIMYDYNANQETDQRYQDGGNQDGGNQDGRGKKDGSWYFAVNTIPESSAGDSDSLYEYEYRERFINFKNNYCDFEEYFDDEPDNLNSGTSYATMAKKPKIESNDFLEMDLGNKKVIVRYDSWHMIISPKPNRFYCMVCLKLDHIRLKSAHCTEKNHIDNLDRCIVVKDYEDYFIRQVDDKLFHCGHCNNLQLIHEMEDHIESNHTRKLKPSERRTRNDSGTSSSPGRHSEKDKYASLTNTPTVMSPLKVNKYNVRNLSPLNNIHKEDFLNIFDSVIIHPFGYKICIPFLAYHVICKRLKDFYCALCDVICTLEDIPGHIREVQHTDLLETTPFIRPFDRNLIRAIKEALHCGICNMPITLDKIDSHIKEALHVAILSKVTEVSNSDAVKYGDNVKFTLKSAVDVKPLTNSHVDVRPLTNSLVDFKPPTNSLVDVKPLTNSLVDVRPLTNSLVDVKPPQNSSTDIKPMFQYESPLNFNVSVNQSLHSVNNVKPELNSSVDVKSATSSDEAKVIVKPKNVEKTHSFLNGVKFKTSNTLGVHNKRMIFNVNQVKETARNLKVNRHNEDLKANQETNEQTNSDSTNIQTFNTFLNLFNQNSINKVQNQDATEPIQDVKTDQEINNKNELNDRVIEETCHEVDNQESVISEASEENEELNHTMDSIASEEATFDVEEYVYLKLGNSYTKIANTSYNTLVSVGDGSRYCFVCSETVEYEALQKHIDYRNHLENLEEYRFLDKYEDHLLRQMFLNYHCSVCNVIITRKQLKSHLEWPTHALQNDSLLKNLKKTRKNEIKSGVRQIVVYTQKENIYVNATEPKIKICLNVQVSKKAEVEFNQPAYKEHATKKNKIIIFNDNVLKVAWDCWHGISKVKNGYRCYLCQRDLKTTDVDTHCLSEWHRYSLDKPFEKQYAPALIRKVNESTLNCLVCNTELSNKDHLVTEHIKGKRHAKNFQCIQKESSHANTYTDCNDDVLML